MSTLLIGTGAGVGAGLGLLSENPSRAGLTRQEKGATLLVTLGTGALMSLPLLGEANKTGSLRGDLAVFAAVSAAVVGAGLLAYSSLD